jgi:preprotein translocase subunit SecD
VLDGEVVSAPTINSAIFGPTEISGQFNQESAQQLAGVLRYGSLPLSFESSEAQTVSATLGLASLQAGLIAGGVGLLLVFVYCLLYYRVLGLLTILSLVLSDWSSTRSWCCSVAGSGSPWTWPGWPGSSWPSGSPRTRS